MTLHSRMHGPLAMMVVSSAFQLLMIASTLAFFGLGMLSNVLGAWVETRSEPELVLIIAGVSLYQGMLKLPQAVLFISGFLTARGAWHIQSGGELRVIRIGAAAAFIGPLFALITNLCNILAFDCCGLVFGGMARVVLVVIGAVAWGITQQALTESEIAGRYEYGESREEAFQRG